MTVPAEAPGEARAASSVTSSVANAAATWMERSRPTSGSASHRPIVLSGCPETSASGARNASNTRPGRVAARQTRPTAAAGTSARTASRSPAGRPPSQDSQLRQARHCGEVRHFHATRSSATPAKASTYSAVSVSASSRQSDLTVASEPRFAGRIQIARLTSMNGSRSTSDRVRAMVPGGRSPQRYASTVTRAAPGSGPRWRGR